MTGTEPAGPADLVARVRSILDTNLYMTLGTADRAGRPWVTPVYYAAADYRELYWISAPETRHSRNIAERPQLSIMVFDSRAPASTGQAVYMSAVAEELTGPDLDRGLRVYPRPAERDGSTSAREQVTPPAPYRLYRATVSEHFVSCPREAGQPCPLHGLAFDHRAAVPL